MTLRLNGSTSGYTELDAPATAGNNTISLPASNGAANQFLKNGATAGTLGWSSTVEDSSGRLLVGTSTARDKFFNTTFAPAIQLESSGTGAGRCLSITNNSATNTNPSILAFGKTRGTSVGGTDALLDGDWIGNISFQGSDGTELVPAAAIDAYVDGTPGANDMPGRLVFSTTADGANSPTEAMRIDSSGKVQIGVTSDVTGATESLLATTNVGVVRGGANANGPFLNLWKTRGATPATNTIVAASDSLGTIAFNGANGTGYNTAATIRGAVDGTPGASNDMPGALIFSTTADGAGSPTERMRITNDGRIYVNTTDGTAPAGQGSFTIFGQGSTISYRADAEANTVGIINRNTDDGVLISLRQANTQEGSISVSGTTVSYNGAHLSRWSQLPGGQEREEILRGTVLSNIDEMCEWGDEENEQLNRMKVSEVEGDKNVSGVFQAWDDDDDTYTNDFYCAMTGDFIIRIAEGVTVERGDLLMSAGDGTAKPQDDDIIRSKTIAKVTSTHVSCTYEDGSYCVPCVLMAC